MTREIKFRALVIGSKLCGYHGMPDSRFAGVDEQEMMIDVRDISFHNGKVDYVTDHEGNEYSFSDGTLKVIRQYTGLKDKNGVEIYEGDVVGFSGCVNAVGHIVYNESLGVYQATAGESSWLPWVESGVDLEVIGNIHEHAHLLEKQS